ncbi:molybdopterin-dependent oxidoreductase [Gemmata sp. JC673]|uniref:Molybdopterin-dependent oxidoreductase n=1 Tax=Gemmata algarum TaxID=2975278 RepID=A0ABU5ERC2_9BACT|nr:molybdopterin-dependent oxidoreductase [Gemmata algarum]
MPGLGTSFGRGAATNFTQDLANSDCILIMGSNMAEAHPVGFRWPMRAKGAGATLIHVDPRFSRTSALCDMFVGIRAGADVAFLGGVVNYVLTHDKWFKEYVTAYTNAATIIEQGFEDAEDLDGLFSGYRPESGTYDPKGGNWAYEGGSGKEQKKSEPGQHGTHGYGLMGVAEAGDAPRTDPTFQHPRCVFQILKRHFARYTPDVVAEVCGCRPEEMVRVAELLCANSGRDRTSAIVYAVGWTQHTTGVQIIRTAGILQLLLGNVGRPGGGIMAMRGHSSIQGSTDVSTLYDTLPGYLPQPVAHADHESLQRYLDKEGIKTGYWSNFPEFVVSLLKAYYGPAATPDNEFGFGWLPRVDGDHSHLVTFDRMSRGGVTGFFLFGQNPAGGGMNAGLQRAALRNLDWLVVADWFETESAVFWKDDPNGPPAKDIKTEVFFIPAAGHVEKEGTLTNTQRLLQWHNKALDPPGEARSDAWFVYQLGKRLRALYAGSTDPKDAPLLNLTWDYEYDHPHTLPDGTVSRIAGEPDVEKVLQEINGYQTAETDPRSGRPKLLPGFSALKADGSTACGCWVYSGVYPEPGRNRANRRERTPGNPVEPNWGFAWPHNRRVLYNRASADPEGRPWSERKRYIWWDEAQSRWVGPDEPDFEPGKAPSYRPPEGARGMAAIGGDQPFIMKTDGLGWLYAPKGAKDGPLPCHYEPLESPVRNLLYPQQASSPTVRTFAGPLNSVVQGPTAAFPLVAFTFRLTEHYLSGPMSRFNSWLNELMPEMFAEIGPELAAARGVANGDWVTVRSARGAIECRALVTPRIKALTVDGRAVHQVGLPFHWGFAGEVVGGNANDLTAIVAEANVSMHEGKVFACQLEVGRHGGNPPAATKIAVPWPTRDPVPDTPRSAQPEGGFAHGG